MKAMRRHCVPKGESSLSGDQAVASIACGGACPRRAGPGGEEGAVPPAAPRAGRGRQRETTTNALPGTEALIGGGGCPQRGAAPGDWSAGAARREGRERRRVYIEGAEPAEPDQ